MVTLTQTFSQLWRGKMTGNPRDFSSAVQQLVTAVCFKLRRLQPCLISSLNVSESDYIALASTCHDSVGSGA